MCFSMKQYPGVCDDVAYNVHSDEEVARVDGFLDSKQEVRHQGAALIIKGQLIKQRGTNSAQPDLGTFSNICSPTTTSD